MLALPYNRNGSKRDCCFLCSNHNERQLIQVSGSSFEETFKQYLVNILEISEKNIKNIKAKICCKCMNLAGDKDFLEKGLPYDDNYKDDDDDDMIGKETIVFMDVNPFDCKFCECKIHSKIDHLKHVFNIHNMVKCIACSNTYFNIINKGDLQLENFICFVCHLRNSLTFNNTICTLSKKTVKEFLAQTNNTDAGDITCSYCSCILKNQKQFVRHLRLTHNYQGDKCVHCMQTVSEERKDWSLTCTKCTYLGPWQINYMKIKCSFCSHCCNCVIEMQNHVQEEHAKGTCMKCYVKLDDKYAKKVLCYKCQKFPVFMVIPDFTPKRKLYKPFQFTRNYKQCFICKNEYFLLKSYTCPSCTNSLRTIYDKNFQD